MGGRSKGGGSVTVGYRYYMSLHMGLCRGPVDEIIEIRVGDKQAFPVVEGTGYTEGVITGSGDRLINAPDLFGGDKKEGGVQGTLSVMMGDQNQVAPSWIKGLLGGLVPDFRGVVTMFFDGLICSLNPYPKKWKFRMRRTLSGWDGDVWQPALATIWLEANQIRAMNPAHIVYECATNRVWGRGIPRARIDDAAWLYAAQVLYNEGFGLCMRWSRQESLQDFVQRVLDHIGGVVYVDRQTGLLTLKLIRNDYDPNTLPLFDYDSGLISFEANETAARDNAVNEVVVKYHSPLNDEDREVRAQNLASIQSLGSINSTNTDYTGIPTFNLAARVAQRDLRINTSAGRRFKVKLDRRAWRIYPGAVFRISAPDKGVQNIVVRAGKVTDGPLTSGEITVEAVIDVFGLPSASFVTQQLPQWTPPDTSPTVIEKSQVREATYRDLVRRLSPADLALVDVNSGTLATMAVKPSSLSLSYVIASRTGTDPFVNRNTEIFVPAVVISAGVMPYDTTLSFSGVHELGLVELGDLIQLGSEIVRLDSLSVNPDGTSGTMTVTRGTLDTIPSAHSSGTVAYFISDTIGTDNREYSQGEVVDVKLLPTTSTATLDPSLAATTSLTIQGRQGRPYPPANVRVNGTLAFNATSVNGAMTISWAHRDRQVQQDQVIGHTDASVGPEAGTTYRIRVYSASNVLLQTFSGITGANQSIPTDLTGALRFELESMRDGLPSLQKYVFSLLRT